ncbi:MAG TPA: F0F1 ATP synthase subunit B [Terriglobia bacterium]|nr:F0F1 ATP synthase subunit B [Terriglobia bacterium]
MNPLVHVEPGLFIWAIVVFLVLLALLTKFGWKPLLEALAAREETIRKSLDHAQKTKEELERVQQESARILQQARIDAEGVLSRSRSDAERLGAELRQKAREESDAIVRNAQRQIQVETRRALDEIRNEAVDLSVTIAGKLLERHVNRQDNERLIDQTLNAIAASKQ